MQTKWTAKLGFIIKQATWKIVENHVRTQFIITWTSSTIIKVDDCFHHNFQTSFEQIYASTWGWI
jgi:hypothetical protein